MTVNERDIFSFNLPFFYDTKNCADTQDFLAKRSKMQNVSNIALLVHICFPVFQDVGPHHAVC